MGVAHVHMADLVRVVDRPDVDVDLVVWDEDPAQARRWADRLGAAVAPDGDDVLADGGLDGVMAFGPPSTHRHIVEAVLADAESPGLPVFVEKPLAVSPDDIAALAALRPSTVAEPFSVGFFLRYAKAFARLRQAVADGVVGDVEQVAVRFVHDGLARGWFGGEHAWMGDPAEGGGGFFDLSVHTVDLVRWVLGLTGGGDVAIDAVKLTGSGHHGTATLHTPAGIPVGLEAGWEAPELTIEMRVTGSSGTLHAHGGQLRHDGEVVFAGPAPDAADAPAAWLAALAGKPHAPLVSVADAVTNARDLLALR